MDHFTRRCIKGNVCKIYITASLNKVMIDASIKKFVRI